MWVFGYGSLLNVPTGEGRTNIRRGQMKGWTRQWRHTVLTRGGRITALTIGKQPNMQVDGIYIALSGEELSEMDQREIGYRRIILDRSSFAMQTRSGLCEDTIPRQVQTYVSTGKTRRWASDKAPILQSYIDYVAAGFYKFYGWRGLVRFFRSTQGWSLPILNDRAAPLYPRAVKLSPELLSFVDDLVRAFKLY